MNMRRLFSLRGLTLLSIMLLAMIATGCAQSRGPAFQREAAQVQPAETGVAVEDIVGQVIDVISVVGDGDAVLIEADGPVRYTAYSLPDPPRLVVDIPGVSLRNIESPIFVDNNFIDEITTSTSGDGAEQIGTIEIALKDGITHNVQSGEDSILINLKRDIFIPGVVIEEDDIVEVEDFDEAFMDEEEEVDVADLFDDEISDEEDLYIPDEGADEEEDAYYYEEDAEVEAAPRGPASNIVSIDSRSDAGRTVVRISGDGEIGNYHSFGLEDPTRLVLDIWGLGSTIPERTVSVGSEFVDKVRIGEHPDKVRLVFDSPLTYVPEHTFSKSRGDLLVAFGESAYEEDVAEDAEDVVYSPPAAEEDEEFYTPPVVEEDEEYYTPPVAAAIEKRAPSVSLGAGAVTIKDVLFRKVKGKARLIVKTSGRADYDVTESLDGKSITLDIMDATIPEDLKMTLDASELKTPVLTISSFQATTEPDNIVRLIVKLKREVEYTFDDSASKIYIDFSLAKSAVKKKRRSDDILIDEDMVAAVEEVVDVEQGYTGQKIDIDMVDADVRDILKLLAEVSDKNIITTSDVSGKVSLRLKDVPWDQVFDIILLMNGLDMIEEGNVIRVAPTAKVAAQRKQKHDAELAKRKLEPLVTEYIRISYDTASGMKPQIEKLLEDDARATVTVHDLTNTLIVKATRKSIEEVTSYISKLDIPTPQVLIEARIVEASSSFTRSLGIQWGADITMGNPSDKIQTVTFGSGDVNTTGVPTVPGSKSTLNAGTPNWAVSLPAANTLGAIGFALGKTGANPMLLDLRISAGETQGLAKTISRPRIVTMNNKEAKIEQGESIPFATGGTEGGTTFMDANLSLTVTPQITPDGRVKMKIKASSNKPGAQANASGERGIDKQEANTEVLVRDGETTVIGGIVVSTTEDTVSGIPFLMDIPILGWLFKNKSVTDSQRELLIFITPTILKE